jgi:hypothetical protein
MGWNLNKYNTFEFLRYSSYYNNIFHCEKYWFLLGMQNVISGNAKDMDGNMNDTVLLLHNCSFILDSMFGRSH